VEKNSTDIGRGMAGIEVMSERTVRNLLPLKERFCKSREVEEIMALCEPVGGTGRSGGTN
jgi:hypothetical protein